MILAQNSILLTFCMGQLKVSFKYGVAAHTGNTGCDDDGNDGNLIKAKQFPISRVIELSPEP